MSDLLIKGGTVVDGTGAPAYKADVRIQDGVIAEIGDDLKPHGEKTYFADGCIVAPGFVESHTHYDATMWWQPDLDPLPGYGVTTIIMGNCGFSAAPISRNEAARNEMIKIFSFFEDIPEGPFLQNLPWDWEKWSEYKTSMLKNLRVPANYASFVGHLALRLAVMGLEAWDRAATPEEIARMAELLDDALAAGALGMSDNLFDHDGSDRPVPTLLANDAEFEALFDVLERYSGVSYQVILDIFTRKTAPEMLDRVARLTKGRKLRIQTAGTIATLDFQKDLAGVLEDRVLEMQNEGYDIWPTASHVAPTNVLSIVKSLIFAQSNDYVWHEVVMADDHEEKRRLLADPEWRARARESWDNKAWSWAPMNNPQRLELINSDNGVGPINITLAEFAESRGLHRSDAMAQWILENGVLSTVHMSPFPKDEEMTTRWMTNPKSVGNITDAGAHGQMLCGGGENVELITKYVMQDKRITLEQAIHILTGKLMNFFGLTDRGELKVGKRGDITVFKLDEIKRREMIKAFDVPDGKGGHTWRFTREPAPMRLTIVNGVITFDGKKFTGEMPGQFLSPVANDQFASAEAAE